MGEVFKNASSLLLFLTLFIPGFLMLKVYDLRVASERRDFTKAAFDAVVYSILNFIALFPITRALLDSQFYIYHPYRAYLSLAIVFIIAPVVWPNLIYWLRCHPLGSKFLVHPKDKAWDAIFSLRRESWIIVHLRDGRKIGGWFSSKSFASSSPAPPEIYLEEVWTLSSDGAFTEQVAQTRGILILKGDILGVEFFSPRTEA